MSKISFDFLAPTSQISLINEVVCYIVVKIHIINLGLMKVDALPYFIILYLKFLFNAV